MVDKHIVVFKNITTGFMNIEHISYVAEIFKRRPELKSKISFILENNESLETNQNLMRIYNNLIGFDIFIAAASNGNVLEYKKLNEFQSKKKFIGIKLDLDKYLNEKYGKIKKIIVESNIYSSILSIIQEEI